MTLHPAKRLQSPKPLVLPCIAGLLGLNTLLMAPSGQAQPWSRPADAPPPLPYPSTLDAGIRPQAPQPLYDSDPSSWSLSEAQLAQRCNLGRLMGGLIGGGLGYATSRQEGRSWAVPLGALLGSQMGCNLGAGRGPVPW